MVWDFFRMLGVGKINAAKGRMDGKVMGVQAKVKGKIANSFNAAVDGGVQKAKGKATGGGPRRPCRSHGHAEQSFSKTSITPR